MAYETGTSSNVNDLLDKLRIFCVANGWTQNGWATIGAGYRLHLSKGSCYINLRSYINESLTSATDLNGYSTSGFSGIGIIGSDGYSAGALWRDQPGRPFYLSSPRGGYAPGISGAIYKYHFFAYPDIDEIHVVLETVVSKFMYLGFGVLDKYNPSALGGTWFSGPSTDGTIVHDPSIPAIARSLIPFRATSYTNGGYAVQSSYVRVNIDGHDGWAQDGFNTSYSPVLAVGSSFYDKELEGFTTNPFGWQTPLLPYSIGIVRAGVAVSPMGEIKHLRRMNITNYNPEDTITLGADTWVTFPMYQKNGMSGTNGFAVRKVI